MATSGRWLRTPQNLMAWLALGVMVLFVSIVAGAVWVAMLLLDI